MDADPAADAVALAFLELYHRDHSAGRCFELGHYLELFPQHANAVAREYLVLAGALEPRSAGDADSSRVPREGARLGPYRLERLLGEGGQGSVWLAEDARLRRVVAIKFLRTRGRASEESARRFRREAEALSRLHHPSVCVVHEAGVEGGVPWYAMRYVEGPTIAEVLRSARASEQGPHRGDGARLDSLTGIARCFEQLARAMQIAHAHGIVHRDLKPGNIVLEPDGTPVILDFGLARDLGGEEGLTRTGEIFGTPAYMAPEQLSGDLAAVDGRADVWSLGVALYECVTLRLPFDAPTREGLYREILSREPRRARAVRRELSRDFDVVIHTALEKDLARRYASAEALAEDLLAVAEDRPIRARSIGALGRLLRWARREPRQAAFASLALVALALASVLVGALLASRDDVELGRSAKRRMEHERAITDGFAELGEGSLERAHEEFSIALGVDPRSAEAAAGLVLVHLERRDGDGALRELDAHRTALAGRSSERYLRARALDQLGRSEQAEALLADIPAARDDVDAFLTGQLHLFQGHSGATASFRAALTAFTSAVLWSSAPRAAYHEARLHAAGHLRDHDAALDSILALRRYFPAAASTHRQIGLAHLHIGDAEAAIAALREARRLDPDRPIMAVVLARALARSGARAEALELLGEELERHPSAIHAHHARGEIRAQQGDANGAVEEFEAELRLQPDWFPTRLERARSLWSAGRSAEAIDALRDAVAARPDHVLALANLGRMLREVGAIEESSSCFRRAIALRERVDDPGSLSAIAGALGDSGDRAAGLALTEELLTRFPLEAEVHLRRARLLSQDDRGDAAIAELRQAISLSPYEMDIHLELAVELAEAGWKREAALMLGACFAGASAQGELRALLGILLVQMGSDEAGLAELRAARAAHPRSARVRDAMGEALFRQGAFQDALALFEAPENADAPALPASEWMERCAAAAASEALAEDLRAGRAAAPAEAGELAWLAEIAARKRWHAECARWYGEATRLDREVASTLDEERGLAIARACLAAAEASDRSSVVAGRCRDLALDVAEAGCATWEARISAGRAEAQRARFHARSLKETRELLELAELSARAALPAAEGPRWKRFFERLDALAAPAP